MEEDDVDFREKNKEQLKRLSMVAMNITKPLSNFYTFEGTSLNKKTTEKMKECPSCGHTYQPSKDICRIQPKIPLTGRVRKLLRKYMQNKTSLGKCHLHIVNRYLAAMNVLKITCSICGKSEKLPGQLREKRSEQKLAKRVSSEEISGIPLRTRREKRKELKLKSKQRKQEKKKKTGLSEESSSSVRPCSVMSIDNCSQPSSSKPTDAMRGHRLIATNNQALRKVTAYSTSDQSFIKDTATSKSIQCHNNKTPVTSKINQSCIKDKMTKCGPVNSKSVKRLKSKHSHQLLGQMLAQQSKASQGGSLKDFLSTL